MNKIDFVISVRNRDNERIQRCVNSLKSDITGKIYVVDYGSDKKIDVKNCEIIKVNTNNIWNKSHALNIGIKKCKNKFIATVDCDMIIGEDFLNKCSKYLDEDVFIFTRNVRRIIPNALDWNLSKENLLTISTNWFSDKKVYSHEAVGGIQIFSKDWIFKINGYDENLTYWGGIDNDIYERAIRTDLILIDLNIPIFHQEHINQKEMNLKDPEEMQTAHNLRNNRRIYLDEKSRLNINVGSEIWGDENNPQQYGVKIITQ